MTEIDLVIRICLALAIFLSFAALMIGYGQFGNKKAFWLFVPSIILVILAVSCINKRDDCLVYTERLNEIRQEIRLHYPELKQELKDFVVSNDDYGITVKQYRDLEHKMKVIDFNKLIDNKYD